MWVFKNPDFIYKSLILIIKIIAMTSVAKLLCWIVKYEWNYVFDTLLISIIPAVAFGRIYYVLTYKGTLTVLDMLDFSKGGISIKGAVVGVIVGVCVYSLYKKSDFLTILDVISPSIAFGDILFRYFGFPVYLDLFLIAVLISMAFIVKSRGFMSMTYGLAIIIINLI